LETPAGLIAVEYQHRLVAGRLKVESVRLTNVASFLHSTDLEAHCPELGSLQIDVAYGGNFYAIVDVQPNFKGVEHYRAEQLVGWSRALRSAINRLYTFIHPEDPTIQGCSHILWAGAVLDANSTARNAVFYGDKAIDRSPCGTGTSARMAQWYAKGKLKKGESFIHESIIGSCFTGRIEEEVNLGSYRAIRPSVEGWARVYGYNTIWIDPADDPYAYGFQVI
jgi:4-hydroxyproline epimerase